MSLILTPTVWKNIRISKHNLCN